MKLGSHLPKLKRQLRSFFVPAPALNIGVNISGFAGQGGAVPGVLGTDYNYTSVTDLSYMSTRGVTTIRIPIGWERLQNTLGGSLNTNFLAALKVQIDRNLANGMTSIIDLHNYCRYQPNLTGTTYVLGDGNLTQAHFVDVWTKLVTALVGYPGVSGYGLMNEPYSLASASVWSTAAQAAINAIKVIDSVTKIYVGGYNFSTAENWVAQNPNFPLTDTTNQLIYEAHAYPDHDSSGSNFVWATEAAATPATTTSTLVSRYTPFVSWCESNGVKGVIGETNTGIDDPNWNTTLDNGLAYLLAHNFPVIFWVWGPDFTSYPYDLHPWDRGRQSRQWPVIAKYRNLFLSPTVYFDGPTAGKASVASTFTVDVRGNVSQSTVFTPNDGGAGGTFSPTSLTIPAGFNGLGTFTYTQASQRVTTLSVTNDKGMTNPSSISFDTNLPTPVAVDLSTGWSGWNGQMQVIGYQSDPSGGAGTVARLQANNNATTHYAYKSLGVLGAGVTEELVVYLHAGSLTQGRITLYNGTDNDNPANSAYLDYDLSVPSSASAATGTGAVVSSSLVASTNGYYIAKLKATLPGDTWLVKFSAREGGALTFTDASFPELYVYGLTTQGPL